jgi:hypothetical protein
MLRKRIKPVIKGSGGYAAYQLGMMQKITFYIVA